jgi:hypothetical protein
MLGLWLVTILLCSPYAVHSEENGGLQSNPFVPGELIVKFSSEAAQAIKKARGNSQEGRLISTGIQSLDSLINQYDAQEISPVFSEFITENASASNLSGVYKITFNKYLFDLHEALQDFQTNPYVEYAELNSIMTINPGLEISASSIETY